MRMQVISYRTTFINPNEALAAHKGHWFSRVVSAGNDLGEDVPATTLRSCAVEYIRRKPISIPSIVRSNRSPCYCQSVCFRYRSGLLGWAKQDNTLKVFLGLLHAPLFGSEPRLIAGPHDEGRVWPRNSKPPILALRSSSVTKPARCRRARASASRRLVLTR